VLDHFREIVVADFEFAALPGERPEPTCLVAWELRSGRRFRIFRGEFPATPPYATGPDVLFVAYYASAEAGCCRVLGWPLPERVLDPFVEFRCLTNGLPVPAGYGLVGALVWAGLDPHGASEKDEIAKAIGADAWYGHYTPEQILDYCERDVEAIARFLVAMAPRIDGGRALLRGRYMVQGASAIEHYGTPVDTDRLGALREGGWDGIKDALIFEIDVDYGVFDGRTFKVDRFAAWLARNNIPWPLHESGRLDLSDEVFREQAKSYPIVSPLRELRSSLAELRLNDLAVSRRDGRNRCLLSAFRARSGRNAPSNSKYIFGPSVWLRGLIKPPPGYAFFYADWRAMEFGILGALSGDPVMQAAYRSGDVYLEFAKQAGAAPADATKTHEAVRDLFKTVVLGVGYGMEEQSLALRIGGSRSLARDLIRAYRETYHVGWRWSNAAVDTAMLHDRLQTVFGWTIHVGENPNVRSLRNFPCQANGSEIMRLAACLIAERGVPVGAVVHDAFGVCSRLENLEVDMATTEAAMREASRVVLNGFELDVEVKTFRWPDRFVDKRGKVMWAKVTDLLDRQGRKLRKAG
jgi:hypothetical protein